MPPLTAEEAKHQLDDIVPEGLALDMFRAEEALSLLKLIMTNADKIIRGRYAQFFGSLQIHLNRQLVLETTKLFQPEDRQYAIRSIPTAMACLKSNASVLTIHEREILFNQPADFEEIKLALATKRDEVITKHFVASWETRLPNAEKIETCLQSKALDLLKTTRDKKIAHDGTLGTAVSEAKYGDIAQLLQRAKSFVRIVSRAYLKVQYTETDSQEASAELKQLPITAGILESN